MREPTPRWPVDAVAPLFVTPRNCEAAFGVRWRWICELAERNEIEVLRVRGKRLLPAGPIAAALRREAEAEARAVIPSDESDEAILARMRAECGLERVG